MARSDDEMDSRSPSPSEKRGRERERSPSKEKRDKSSSSDGDRRPPSPRREERAERTSKTMDVDKDDAAFVLGRGGATKRKVARVSGAEIELDEKTLTVTVQGSKSQCSKAEDYINFIRQQRVGPVAIDATEVRDDFTAYPVPSDCIGFVMGRNGQTLRSMEEEWGVLMFFAKIDASKHSGEDTECLCIFGPLPARRGAELKTMSAVEHKHPGYCVSSKGDIKIFDRVKGDEDEGGWGVDTMPLSEENFSYALGSQGSTRKKLAAASGCIIEYVGRLACFSGYKKDRRRGKDYLRWLLEQRTGQSVVTDPKARDDITILKVPSKSVAYLTGYRGESLRGVERESSTFCFTDGDRNDHTKESENLLIFSYSRSAREHAAEIVEDRLASHKRIGEGGGRRDDRDRRDDDRGGGDRYGGGGGGDRFGGGGGGGGGGRDESCWDFQKGRCTRGAQCRFSHADPGGGGGGGGDRDRRDRSRERDSGRRGDRDRRERSRSRDRDRKKSSRRGRSESDDSDHDRRRRR